jgi:hypothetical protein
MRCPECGVEAEFVPRYGDEIVSVYCLKHTEGADQHTRPVYMTPIPVAESAPRPKQLVA